MEFAGVWLIGALYIGITLYWTVRVARFAHPGLLALVWVVDGLVGMTGSPMCFLLWKLCLFYGLVKWRPLAGLFVVPRWPRIHQRGRRGRRPREFREPMLWERGPGSY